MPEPSGTGTTTDDQQGTAGQGATGGASDSGAGASGTDQQSQRLSQEAAKWRTQYRSAQEQIANLTKEIEELKSKSSASPGGEDTSELAKLKRELGELNKTVKEAQERASKAEEARRQEKLDNALLKAVSDAKLLDPDEAMIILRNKGRARIADDGKPVFVIVEDGEEREVTITPESIKQHKLVSERFFPADGVAGAGSKGGVRGQAANGLDYERGLRDQAYFNANKAAMEAEFRRRNAKA